MQVLTASYIPLFAGVLFGTAVLTPVVISWLRRRGVVDRPGHRSSHSEVTVRGAGGALAVSCVVGGLLTGDADIATVAVLAAALSVLGLWDDVRGLSAHVRLPGQVVVGVTASLIFWRRGLLPSGWVPIAVLWVTGYVNAFNFMDGINGISGVHASVVGIAWIVAGVVTDAPTVQLLGGLVAAVACGFLPFNFPRAKGFLGDVGSYFLGTWLALAGLVVAGRVGYWAAVLPVSPYIADTSWTLVSRLRRGQRWSDPHRDHIYQQLIRGGWTHARTTVLMGLVTALTSALGVIATAVPTGPVVAASLAGGLVVNVVYLMSPKLAFGEAPGLESQKAAL